MKAFNIFILYRFPIGILLLLVGITLGITIGWWEATILLVLGVICLVTHLMFGPMRLVQEAVEAGDIEKATALMNQVKFPKLLYKPIRSVYFFMQSNMAMYNKDLDKAEATIRQSIKSGSPMKEYEGMQYFQLGTIAYQKNDLKTADQNLKKAIRMGLPDKENTAAALLTVASIAMSRRDFKSAKDYFRRAKAQKPTTDQIVSQIKEMDKYISRMPG
ncbi:tetratricopeptide repeat protein [Chitinophaga defluvii]|uniref:Tetratricopeptide repeat protein n=1 Tax=Chitinophaga defluvii TaxID=3163343 RepID=A0ABV2T6S2_9BACT